MGAAGLRIETARLSLVAGTQELLASEIAGRDVLGGRLAAAVLEDWPPELYDRPAIEQSWNYIKRHPGAAGWILWYVLLRNAAGGRPVAIGICGFKGEPAPDGTVEIGYSILRSHQRRGYATEAVAALLERAFSDRAVRRVVAETYPDLAASIRVMEKNGLSFIGPGSAPGVVRYERRRSDAAGAGG